MAKHPHFQKAQIPDWVRRKVYERDEHRCFYCGLDVQRSGQGYLSDGPSLDHLTPESRGGANTPDNLVTACRACNSRKRHMTLEEYREHVRVSNEFGAAQAHLLAAYEACDTPFGEHILDAVEWLEDQMLPITFWAEREDAS